MIPVVTFGFGLICLIVAGFLINMAAGFAVLGVICVALGLLVDFSE